MANTPRKIRIPRPLYPWSNPSGQFDDPVEQYVNRVLQDLERVKLEIATVNATGALYGDILVADINKTFQPQKFVPLNLGVGLSANPIYRFQVQDMGVDMHLTASASGGAYGLTLNSAASGTNDLAYMLASGGVVLWEIGFDLGGNLLLRSHPNSANVFVSDSSGNIQLLRDVSVGHNLTVTGSTVLFGNVTTGPLVANTLQVTGNTWLFGTNKAGPLTVNTLVVTGTTTLFGTTTTGPLIVNTLQVTGNSWLFGNANTGPLVCNSLTVTGSAAVSGNCAVSGDFIHQGAKVGLNGATPVARDSTYIQNYVTADRTLSAYTPNNESAAYTGLASGVGGTPYASLSDLNTLRVGYENLRALTEDLAQFVNSLVDYMQSRGDIG